MRTPRPKTHRDLPSLNNDQRRAEKRAPLEREVELVLLDSFDRPVTRLRVPTINITRRGIGLLSEQPLPAGAVVIVVLSDGVNGRKRLVTGGVVRFCSDQPTHRRSYRVGVEFLPRAAMTNAFANLDAWRLSA